MKRLLSLGFLGFLVLSLTSTSFAATKKVTKKLPVKKGFAILDFEESGRVSRGIGRTLAMVLYSSMNARRTRLIDPMRLRDVLTRHQWSKKHELTGPLLKELQKRGVGWMLTGTVGRHYKTFSATYRLISMKGRILHSEVLPSVQSWVGLVSTMQYSVRALIKRSRGKTASRLGRKKVKKGKKGKKKKKVSRKAFAKLIKGTKLIKGLFPLYLKVLKNGTKKVLMEVSPKQLGKIFMISPTLEGGTGGSLITFAQLPEFPFVFKKQEDKLLMIGKNVDFRVSKKAAVSRIFNRSFTDSLRASTAILSEPHPKRKSFLVDLSSFFMWDLMGLRYWIRREARPDGLRRKRRRVYGFDRRHSVYSSLKGYPKNVEIGIKAYFTMFPFGSRVLPPGRAVGLLLRYSISQLVKTGYQPRFADDRVGYFMMVAKDYTHDRVDSRYTRYITRWHLEKKEPGLALSEPKKPIVFWLENGIPYKHRLAVAKGVLVWNKAFERIGFRKAIRVFQQPANAKWDGADVRYNTVRWFLADQAGFAQGPSRIDPLTGQIYDADIRVSSDMVSFLHRQFEQLASPMRWMQQSGLQQLLNPNAQGRSLDVLRKTLQRIKQLPKSRFPTGWRSCDYARGAMRQATLGWHLLNMRGMLGPSTKEEDKYIHDFLIGVIAHEVGHTLGLRHNFKASTLHDHKALHNSALTKKEGLTNSMMEYTPVNVALPGEKQGQYWQTTLGPYDYWAIEYGYKPLQVKAPKDELPELNKIASRVANHKLAYATDEDASFSGPYSIDPEATRWDLGKDPLVFYTKRAQLGRELWKRVEKKFGGKKSSYQKIRKVFSMGVGMYLFAGMQSAKFVGGIHHRRDHIGDPNGRVPFAPVDAKHQRRALKFMIDNYFGNTIEWSPSLLNKLGPNRLRGFSWSRIFFSRVDYPVHRVALLIQVLPLYRLFHPAVLGRIQDNRLRLKKGADALSLSELFESVSKAVWKELAPSKEPKAKISVVTSRRNLQRFHLELLVAYSLTRGLVSTDASAITKLELKELQDKINAALPRVSDKSTKAHLYTCLSRIKEALKVTLIRLD